MLEVIDEVVKKINSFYSQDLFSGFEEKLSSRRLSLKFVFFATDRLKGRVFFNFLLIVAVVLFSGKVRKPSISGGIFELSLSKNNRRVLERLNKVLCEKGSFQIDVEGDSVTLLERVKCLYDFSRLCEVAKNISSDSGGVSSFVHLQKVIGCASVFIFIDVFRRCLPQMLCVANDHVPICFAALSTAKYLGVKRCYVQHAPVTRYFPPLDYDLSVLFDRASLEVYQNVAKDSGVSIPGRVVILPPFLTSFTTPRVSVDFVTVGVFVSFLPDEENLLDIVRSLLSKGSVGDVVLRRHPRCQRSFDKILSLDKVSMQASGETIDEFLSKVDVALVPNSGVAIEALHSGCPTFYTPSADKISDDYYGFVTNGVLPVFDLSVLEDLSKVNHFFDLGWLERFSQFDDTVNASPAINHERVFQAFSETVS